MPIQQYFKSIAKYLPITKEEEKELFKKAKNGDRKAYEKIINSNLRFVVSIAKYYVGKGLELEDLISEGNIGLIKAYNSFDYTKNFKFITYAVWWIRQTIMIAINDYGKTIRIPSNKLTTINKAMKAKNKLEQKAGDEISMSNIHMYTADDYIIDSLRTNITIHPLEEPMNSNGFTLKDVLFDETSDFNKSIEIFFEELSEILKDFPDREKDIIYMYYGINRDYPLTLTEIGEQVGLTRERIRQIKKKSLEKIKEINGSNALLEFLK